jgi:hypothetical protein
MLLELMPDIVDQRGLSQVGDPLASGFEPAGEVEQVIGVRELPDALG